MKNMAFAAVVFLAIGCSVGAEDGAQGDGGQQPSDRGHETGDRGGAADVSETSDVSDPSDTSHPSEAGTDGSPGTEDAAVDLDPPDAAVLDAGDAGSGDTGDAGTVDACAGKYGPQCLREIFEAGDECSSDKAAAIDRIARELAAAMELPMQYLDDAWFIYVGDAAKVEVAGDFNDWTPEALERLCGLDVWALKVVTGGGKYEYKYVVDGNWVLDPANRAFAYDGFAGNADRKNSVLNFWGSGKSHLEWWRNVESAGLGNTRDLFVYVPAYYNPMGAQAYPVLYMHDGQNIFDDTGCCFGHGGWEVNNAADAEIVRAGLIPYFIVGIANTSGRADEYTPCIEDAGGNEFGGKADLYEAFLIETVFPLVESHYHIYPQGRAIAGSSLGGVISMYVGLRNPSLFPKGIGSMSGAFWVCKGDGKAVRDQVAALPGHLDLAVYLDSGGDLASGDDSANDTAEVRDLLIDKGWLLWEAKDDAPCAGAYDLCYHLETGAQHNESAWRDRVWRMLRYLQ